MNPPLRLTLGILLIAASAISGLGYMVFSLVRAFSTLERFDAPGGHDATLEPGDYTVYWETAGVFVSDNPGRPEVRLTVDAGDGLGNPTVNAAGLWVSHYSTGSRIGVSLADFRIERKGVYTVSARAPAGKTLPRGGIAITRSLGMFGVFRLVLATLLLVGSAVSGGLVLLLRRK